MLVVRAYVSAGFKANGVNTERCEHAPNYVCCFPVGGLSLWCRREEGLSPLRRWLVRRRLHACQGRFLGRPLHRRHAAPRRSTARRRGVGRRPSSDATRHGGAAYLHSRASCTGGAGSSAIDDPAASVHAGQSWTCAEAAPTRREQLSTRPVQHTPCGGRSALCGHRRL